MSALGWMHRTSGRPKYEELFGSQKMFKSYLKKGQLI
jgi:hypothetical protein